MVGIIGGRGVGHLGGTWKFFPGRVFLALRGGGRFGLQGGSEGKFSFFNCLWQHKISIFYQKELKFVKVFTFYYI